MSQVAPWPLASLPDTGMEIQGHTQGGHHFSKGVKTTVSIGATTSNRKKCYSDRRNNCPLENMESK